MRQITCKPDDALAERQPADPVAGRAAGDADWRPALSGRRRRRGAVLSIELLLVLPLAIGAGLAIVQFILIATAQFRLEAAALEGAKIAANAGDVNMVFNAVTLTLGSQLDDHVRVDMEYQDADLSGSLQAGTIGGDYTIVSVIVPMEVVGRNYLGFLGGNVVDLKMQAVVQKPLDVDVFP